MPGASAGGAVGCLRRGYLREQSRSGLAFAADVRRAGTSDEPLERRESGRAVDRTCRPNLRPRLRRVERPRSGRFPGRGGFRVRCAGPAARDSGCAPAVQLGRRIAAPIRGGKRRVGRRWLWPPMRTRCRVGVAASRSGKSVRSGSSVQSWLVLPMPEMPVRTPFMLRVSFSRSSAVMTFSGEGPKGALTCGPAGRAPQTRSQCRGHGRPAGAPFQHVAQRADQAVEIRLLPVERDPGELDLVHGARPIGIVRATWLPRAGTSTDSGIASSQLFWRRRFRGLVHMLLSVVLQGSSRRESCRARGRPGARGRGVSWRVLHSPEGPA